MLGESWTEGNVSPGSFKVDLDLESELVEREDEEVLVAHKGSSEDAEFDAMVGLLEDVLVSEAFQCLQRDFYHRNCAVFDDGEELKLEYSSLHRKYMDLVEGFIADECRKRRPEWSMERVLKVLSSGSVEDMTGDVFDLLLSLSDVQEFVQVMLSYKYAKDGSTPDLSIG